jgi:hypothetical protein
MVLFVSALDLLIAVSNTTSNGTGPIATPSLKLLLTLNSEGKFLS